MKTILVCNQKGGVGKSLVADEIAFSFERSGISVSFYDLDAQGGILHCTHEALPVCPWSSSTAGARPRGRRTCWWKRCARLRGSRRNNRRSEPCSVWTN